MLARLWVLGWLLATHLLERVGIKQDPSKLNHLGRVLCHIDAVLVAGGRNVDDDVAIDVKLGQRLRRHGCGGFGRTRTEGEGRRGEDAAGQRRRRRWDDDEGIAWWSSRRNARRSARVEKEVRGLQLARGPAKSRCAG